MKFNIHRDFSEDTGIRHSKFSETSGEDFYHEKLNDIFYQCYTSGEKLELELDGKGEIIDKITYGFIQE